MVCLSYQTTIKPDEAFDKYVNVSASGRGVTVYCHRDCLIPPPPTLVSIRGKASAAVATLTRCFCVHPIGAAVAVERR